MRLETIMVLHSGGCKIFAKLMQCQRVKNYAHVDFFCVAILSQQFFRVVTFNDDIGFLIFYYKEKAQIILTFIYPREYFRPPARIKHS